jgi:glycosyltransferase involved in cell wall biosynthesis
MPWLLILFYWKNNMSIQISIVIPTFRRPQLLIKCLTALKEQTFIAQDYEVIVVADGPDDRTKTEVAYFKYKHSLSNFFFTNLQHKAGPAAARNKGAQLSRGKLIAFTDDDCIPQYGWLQALWNAFLREQKSEIAFTGKTIVPHNEQPTDYEKNIANLETAEFITANCACTKTTFNKSGGFDEEFSIAWREDSDLHFKLLALNIPIIRVQNAVVVHPVRNAPWGVSLKEQEKSKYNALLSKKHPLLYKEKIASKPLWNYYAIVTLLPLAIHFYMQRKPIAAAILTMCWLLLVSQFIFKRLNGTSKKPAHVLEMIATSVVIPFLSVFWTLYGSLKYKKFLL